MYYKICNNTQIATVRKIITRMEALMENGTHLKSKSQLVRPAQGYSLLIEPTVDTAWVHQEEYIP